MSDEPKANPYLCMAYGCPLGGSMVADGQRTCFVHWAIRDMDKWAKATARMRYRMGMIQAIEVLRSPGLRTDEMAIADAVDWVPEISADATTRHKALVDVENQLLAIAKADE